MVEKRGRLAGRGGWRQTMAAPRLAGVNIPLCIPRVPLNFAELCYLCCAASHRLGRGDFCLLLQHKLCAPLYYCHSDWWPTLCYAMPFLVFLYNTFFNKFSARVGKTTLAYGVHLLHTLFTRKKLIFLAQFFTQLLSRQNYNNCACFYIRERRE